MRQLTFLLLFFTTLTLQAAPPLTSAELKIVERKIASKLTPKPTFFEPWKSESLQSVSIKSTKLTADRSRLNIYCNAALAQISIRPEIIEKWGSAVRDLLGDEYADCNIRFYADNIPIERYIPNLYRTNTQRDPLREYKAVKRPPLVQPLGDMIYGKGLNNTHIALWAGHGQTFTHKDEAWKWQRPALFCSSEDLNTIEFTTQLLAPMLENAGAVIVMPRERDPNPTEIIVDNDPGASPHAKIEKQGSWSSQKGGFAVIETLDQENPFSQGSYLQTTVSGGAKSQLTYRPNMPQSGRYGIYVSYRALPTNLTRAIYTVYHTGGAKSFEVNQRIGGSMWVWLGSFELDGDSYITLSAPDGGELPVGATMTADAVKIGGGMGNIKRGMSAQKACVSGYPRYHEAARYWMQYSGVSDSIYAQDTKSIDNKENLPLDYTDNFKGNGDWCNFLIDRRNVPLDLALGIHTDAGVSDSTYGTLSIYFSKKTQGKYPNGKSKMADRDMADIIQTQIVNDLRAKYNPTWRRRSIYDKSYAEISRPNVPSVLIEILSHQNAADMALWLDPEARFDIARSIYKGVVRFMADRSGRSYTIQPLPPHAMASEFVGSDSVRVKWEATLDPLEATAIPSHYKIYTRIGDGAFDDGSVVSLSGFDHISMPLPADGKIRSYRITAVNDGGESFPSETISVGRPTGGSAKGIALVVNGFTRLSAPLMRYDTIPDTTGVGRVLAAGFDLAADPGVPYMHQRAISGAQQQFSRTSLFVDNDNPGWGASSKELEIKGINGNNFDYIYDHGKSLMELGYSFVGTSREAFENDPFVPSKYRLIDLIMGAQRGYPTKYKVYTDKMLSILNSATQAQVKIIISGAYIASDPSHNELSTRMLGYTLGRTSTLPASARTADMYPIPQVDILKGVSPQSRVIPIDGVGVSIIRTGNVTAVGVPLEAFSQSIMSSILRKGLE